MTPFHTRVAAGAAALLFAISVVNVSMAVAQAASSEQRITTTCGAGTIDACGKMPVETCDFSFGFSFDPGKNSYSFNFGRTNCKTTGEVPIYKDNWVNASMLSLSCNFLAPFLGMPAGSGCSDE